VIIKKASHLFKQRTLPKESILTNFSIAILSQNGPQHTTFIPPHPLSPHSPQPPPTQNGVKTTFSNGSMLFSGFFSRFLFRRRRCFSRRVKENIFLEISTKVLQKLLYVLWGFYFRYAICGRLVEKLFD
jgi:hypothetical protein